uniref:Receptor L-domain domain-containing protein n=1 Tax=Onchocerca volvulus TaxID=6282 RepID=A0A8R1TS52_ONCVO
MHYWLVAFLLLTFRTVNVTSRTLMIFGKIFGKNDEQNMEIFLEELKMCQHKGDKMEAIIIENRSIIILQNRSIHSMSNLTKQPFTEFNIILKDITISNNQCDGMVLDASLNYNQVKLLLLCYPNGRIIERDKWEKNKNDFIRYHFVSNEVTQKKKVKEEDGRLWEKVVILSVLIIAFICAIVSNIHDDQIPLTSSNNKKSNLLIPNKTNDRYHYKRPYHVKLSETYHSTPYFDRNSALY